MKKLFFALLMLVSTLQVGAQQPVKFDHEVIVNGSNGKIIFYATIEKGYYLYSCDSPGGFPLSLNIAGQPVGVELDGGIKPVDEPKTKFDSSLGSQIAYFEEYAEFEQSFRIVDENYSIEGYLRYQACGAGSCVLEKYPFTISNGEVAAATPVAQPNAPAETVEAPAEPKSAEVDTWAPVNMKKEKPAGSIWTIFILGFGGGLLALLTPCVWPIIPMTVSFFLKRSKERKQAIREAVLYGASIVVIYLVLGLVVTLLFGPAALNELATNAYFNVFFFLMLLVFGASFLGGFELKLPSSWTNKVDSKASSTTGVLSIFLMAFTLALVSFSCTGPIIGFLLVETATSGDILAPAVGMLGFALALALPFTIFAIFPSLLKQAPRSGGWMNTIKVVLGFVEIAFALKFLSVADLTKGWGILDRETFLALWIILFTLLGLYLLKIFHLPHDDSEDKKTSVPAFFTALISLSFAVYMIPGLWGAPCKAISAFAPPMSTQDFSLYNKTFEPDSHDYDEAIEISRAKNKPILLDFTGHGCVNCREMEASVLTDGNVLEMLEDNFVVVSLYVDDREELAEPFVGQDGNTYYDVGEKWSYLQKHKFGAAAQPFYVIVDSDGNLLGGSSFAFNTNVSDFLDFLDEGLEDYNDK